MNQLVKIGTVHGRFQPPHLDHLEYILAGLARCERVVIGITQPDVSALSPCPEDPHRALQSSNPMTYEERTKAITLMLLAEGVSQERFSFTKFPIETPDLLPEFVPQTVKCFTTIRDEWNETKIHRLRELGYDVEVLWDRRDKAGLQGTIIRNRIACRDPNWAKGLHPAVANYLVELDVAGRLNQQTSEQ